ncbi:MAG TPA: transglutaminase family protein [Gemmataceae bacterium]|jgi:transglutaminase-like putative cysteine protease|nr:transglutaminase family protein [Gemmataceae bacterium]
MILEVQHETRFEFSEPVTEVLTEVRMEPASDGDQSCHSYHLAVTPATGVFRHQDGFGNRVHHFNLLSAQRELRILSASIVETHRRPRDLAASRSAFPLDPDGHALDVLDFVKPGGPARPTARLGPLLEELRPQPGGRVADLVLRVAGHIHARFEYARDVTLASSPIDDVLREGKGVCQDFTHLMIALLRSFGVPARYVSGYLHRAGESQSHAWCEAWVPDLGWLGIDPTNDCLADDHFVRVAVGRDFTDVPPNRGVYRGRARESISVRVATRALERVPSLSWQEQLPPLTVPLTAIVPRPRPGPAPDEDLQQQQ